MDNMPYDPHILEIFKKESRNSITRVNNLLLRIEDEGASSELYKNIKGEVHTLKGDARMLGFESISLAAHKLEDLFALLEKEEIATESFQLKNVFDLLDAIEHAVTKLPDELVTIDISVFFNEQPGEPAEKNSTEKSESALPEKKEDVDVLTSLPGNMEKDKDVPVAEYVESGKDEKTKILNIVNLNSGKLIYGLYQPLS